MKIMRRAVINLAIFTLALAGMLFFALSTNQGLTFLYWAAKPFYAKELTIQQLEGNLLKGVNLKSIAYQDNQYALTITEIKFKLNVKKLLSTASLTIPEFSLTNAEIKVLKGNQLNATKIVHLAGSYLISPLGWELEVKELQGNWQAKPMQGKFSLSKSELQKYPNISYANIVIADNKISLEQKTTRIPKLTPKDKDYSQGHELNKVNAPEITWKIQLNSLADFLPKLNGKLHSSGNLTTTKDFATILSLDSNLDASNLAYQQYSVGKLNCELKYNNQLNAPLTLKAFANELKVKAQNLKTINLNINSKEDIQQAVAKLKLDNYNTATIEAHSKMNGPKAWTGSIDNISLKSSLLKNWQLLQPAQITFANRQLQLEIITLISEHGDKLNFNSTWNAKKDNLSVNANVISGKDNSFQGQLEISKLNAEQNLKGKLSAKFKNLNWFMRACPSISRLKAEINGNIDIQGNLRQPKLTSQFNLTKGTVRIPALAMKIKPFTVTVNSNNSGKFFLTGNGAHRNAAGDFQIAGEFEPFKPDFPNSFAFNSRGIEFVNTPQANAIADANLKFSLQDLETLTINGDIYIPNGSINLDQPQSNTTVQHTADVTFVDELPLRKKSSFNIIPNINLKIEKGFVFKGFGLDSTISGKVTITKPEHHLLADGRITIKKGTYKLPGQTMHIASGRLIYAPGTLLNNPTLDIKMLADSTSQKASAKLNEQTDASLYIQGTANNPEIHNSGLLNGNQIVSQMLNATGSPVLSQVKKKLALEQFGIESSDATDERFTENNPTPSMLDNKNLVVGKQLTKKAYVQYIKSLMDTNSAVKLKYILGNYWTVEVESGSSGNGADLSFSTKN